MMRRLVAIALLTGWYAVAAVWIAGQGRPEKSADAAIVLGAAAWGSRPSPALRSRIDHALTLYQAGQVGKLVFTGGIGLRSAESEAAVAARYAIARGIPPEDIVLEERSTNTVENLRFAAEIARQHGLESFLIVSNRSHICRATVIARRLGLDATGAPVTDEHWLYRSTRLRLFVREVGGCLLYRFPFPI
jgi:uncharacterized SAM-binding protein YcdF (DUF218 family)